MMPSYGSQSGSGANELFELKQQVKADAKRIERLEQQAKLDAASMAEMKRLINELKLFKDEIIAWQQLTQQAREKLEQDKQQSIGVLQQQSKIVSHNSGYMDRLAQWMSDVGYKLHSRLYRASENGWEASNFHQCCDNKGATLIIVKVPSGRIFGGFTVNPWQSNEENVSENGDKAWLFSLNSTVGQPIRLSYIQGRVQGNHSSHGPIFGTSDLCMYLLNSNLITCARCHFKYGFCL